MRWRTIDRIDGFEPWATISARKVVSFEEGALLERFGRDGEYPFTLAVEGCVEAARWLVAASSGFTSICLLEAIDSFRLEERIETGDCLQVSVGISERTGEALTADCRIERRGRIIGTGAISLTVASLGEHCDPGSEATLWRELHGKAGLRNPELASGEGAEGAGHVK